MTCLQKATMMDRDAHQWHERMAELMADGAHIIAFRGAGSINGIDPAAMPDIIQLIALNISSLSQINSTVVIMYDGDDDVRTNPDIGAVFGSIADLFAELPSILPIAAQSAGWYSPKHEGGTLESANGTPYETYVFPDDMSGAHSALTQSNSLVEYPNYEQIFVGPAGKISFHQLANADDKAAYRVANSGPLKIVVYRTTINHELDQALQRQLEDAGSDEDRTKIRAKIDQRVQQPYGALFTAQGEIGFKPQHYPHLDIQVVEL